MSRHSYFPLQFRHRITSSEFKGQKIVTFSFKITNYSRGIVEFTKDTHIATDIAIFESWHIGSFSLNRGCSKRVRFTYPISPEMYAVLRSDTSARIEHEGKRVSNVSQQRGHDTSWVYISDIFKSETSPWVYTLKLTNLSPRPITQIVINCESSDVNTLSGIPTPSSGTQFNQTGWVGGKGKSDNPDMPYLWTNTIYPTTKDKTFEVVIFTDSSMADVEELNPQQFYLTYSE